MTQWLQSWFGNEPCETVLKSPSLLPLTGDQRETQKCASPLMMINIWDLSRKRATKYMSLASEAWFYSREAASGVRGKLGEHISGCTSTDPHLLLHCSSMSCLPHTLLSPTSSGAPPHPSRAEETLSTGLVSPSANLPPLGEKALL